MRILLTGSTGQIGWELHHVLRGRGQVITPTRGELDLADADSIVRAIQGARPDVVINAGGYTAVDRAEREPDLVEQTNGIGPGVLAEQAWTLGAAFVHFSTDYVFDGTKSSPYEPDDEPAPINVYGRSKLHGERNVRAAHEEALILRLSWVYGLRRRNFMLAMLEQARQRSQLNVVDDQYGCPTPCSLVALWTAQVIRHALHRSGQQWLFAGHAGTYHLACSGRTSWCGLARRIIELADLPRSVGVVPITTAEYPTPARRPQQSVLDCTKTAAAFDIEFTNWDQALQQVMTDYRASQPSPAGSTTNGI